MGERETRSAIRNPILSPPPEGEEKRCSLLDANLRDGDQRPYFTPIGASASAPPAFTIEHTDGEHHLVPLARTFRRL